MDFLVSYTGRWPCDVTIHLAPNRLDSKIFQLWNRGFTKYLENYLCRRDFVPRDATHSLVGNSFYQPISVVWNDCSCYRLNVECYTKIVFYGSWKNHFWNMISLLIEENMLLIIFNDFFHIFLFESGTSVLVARKTQ